jgi:hypothetical protein
MRRCFTPFHATRSRFGALGRERSIRIRRRSSCPSFSFPMRQFPTSKEPPPTFVLPASTRVSASSERRRSGASWSPRPGAFVTRSVRALVVGDEPRQALSRIPWDFTPGRCQDHTCGRGGMDRGAPPRRQAGRCGGPRSAIHCSRRGVRSIRLPRHEICDHAQGRAAWMGGDRILRSSPYTKRLVVHHLDSEFAGWTAEAFAAGADVTSDHDCGLL